MANYALIRDGMIENVAVVEPDTDQGRAYLTAIAADVDDAVDLAGYDPQPGIGCGWANGPIPPPSLIADPTSIPADGTTTSTVTYTDDLPNAPASVEFDVNGATQTVQMTGGKAQIAVVSATPGDTVTVTCQSLTVQIGVQ